MERKGCFLLVGNYGVGNFGDEALKEYFLETFTDVKWIVVSQDVPRLPFGIRSFFTPWWKTLRAYWTCDGIVFGGGSLFTDIESVKAPILWLWHAVPAFMFRKKIFCAFQGIGPCHTRIGAWCARAIVRHADFISVRDDASFERVRGWGRDDVIKSFDPIFTLFHDSSLSQRERVRERGSEERLVLIPRYNSAQAFLHKAKDVIAKKHLANVRILSLQSSDFTEHQICRQIKDAFPGSEIVPIQSVPDLIREISQATLVISERFHGALAAFACGVPYEVVSQKEGDKLSSLDMHIDKNEAVRRIQDGEKSLRALFHTS
jgi:polysaccharide pyruvyl transferase WcaK-like protein